MSALPSAGHPDRAVIMATIDDALHFSDEERARIIASYPEHEREARTKGIPALGSGRVFPIPEESIKVEPFQIPHYMPQIVGVDFGYDHPFAAARLAWDRDNDIVYVIAVYRQREATPPIHASAIKSWGDWLPVAWPHDGHAHEKGTGIALAAQYREQDLEMLPEHATFKDGGYKLEPAISEMLTRMQTGRWKVFSTCGEWFEEFRLYHREGGLIVKERDDAISASRYGMMMLRHASVKPKTGDWERPANKWVV